MALERLDWNAVITENKSRNIMCQDSIKLNRKYLYSCFAMIILSMPIAKLIHVAEVVKAYTSIGVILIVRLQFTSWWDVVMGWVLLISLAVRKD